MFKHLKFDASYSNGDSRSGDHVFEEGMTGIAGANESGKSLRFEYIRFGLFGSDALRATKDKYNALNVMLAWDMAGVEYMTNRTLNTAQLFKDGELIAKSPTAVNKAVISLLGYEMKVFDVANACLQGKIEQLTDMKPTERKTMVDKVVGLDGIDNLNALVTTRAKGEVAALTSLQALKEELVVPVEPIGYEQGLTAKAIEEREILARERAQLQGQLVALKCEAPGCPVWDNPVTESLEDLLKIQSEYDAAAKAVAGIKIPALPKAPETDVGSLQAYLATDIPEKWQARKAWELEAAKYSKPEESQEYYAGIIAQLTINETQKAIAKVREKDIQCPHCTKSFSLTPDLITSFEQSMEWAVKALAALSEDQRNEIEEWSDSWTMDKARAEIERSRRYDQFYENNPAPEQVPVEAYRGGRAVVQGLVAEHSTYIAVKKQYDDAWEQLAKLNGELATKTNVSAKIEQVKKQDAANLWFNEQNRRYGAYVAKEQEIGPRLKELANVDEELLALRNRLRVEQQYETELAKYNTKVETQSRITKDVELQEAKVQQLKVVREALMTLKPKVKSYLMPSLNMVASNLLSQMTNGSRNAIYISEDFDILVDGQGVETLSGSGKAVVNLAIRVALGSVLTNKVLSVFLADEVDAAMRGERAAYTAQCFKNLTKIVKQIIIISHKELEVDRLILV